MSHHYQGAATSSPPDQPPPEALRLLCEEDGRVHLATVASVEADIVNDTDNTYTALCGHEIALALFGTPPGPDCLDCQQRPHQRTAGGRS